MSIRSITVFLMMLFLAACGSSSSDDGGSAQRPLAIASADAEQVNAGEQTVELDGRDSSSPNGDITGWEWRFINHPEGSETEIETADQPQASFTPDLPGEYVVLLTVSDAEGDSEDRRDSRVTIVAANPNPLAVVSGEINWILGTVQLDGSRSRAPDGGDQSQLMYEWTLTEKPEGSEAELDQGSLIYPRFTADVVGTYKTELVVTYDDRVSQAATTTIHIVEANSPPMAKVAELEGPIVRGQTVTLDGSLSEDADGDPLQYRWRFTELPAGSGAELTSLNTAQTSFLVDVVGGFSLELCVFDGMARNCTLTGVAKRNITLPEGASNTAPVAVITADSWNQKTFEAELGAEMRLASRSFDVDGDALTEQWRFVSYPNGYDPQASSNLDGGWSSSFTPTEPGEYELELTVSDGELTNSTTQVYTALLGANRAPTAVAAVANNTPTTMVGTTVMLDGEGSSDPDDNRLSYQWQIQQRPDHSTATLESSNTAHPTLTPDQPGPYVISLVVTDDHGWSTSYLPRSDSEAVILAKDQNNPPITRINRGRGSNYPNFYNSAIYDTEQPFAIRKRYTECYGGDLECRADALVLTADSYDPDGDALSHLWMISGQEPEGNIFELNHNSCNNGTNRKIPGESYEEYKSRVQGYREWTCETIGLAPTKPGLYALEYQVYDGTEFAGPYTATVETVLRADYPTLLLESVGEDHSVIEQLFFPEKRLERFPLSRLLRDEPTEIQSSYFSLTAFGGDYTITDIQLSSIDSGHTPRFMDVTNGQEITEGYLIEQGQSVVVSLVIPFGLSSSDYNLIEARTKMNDANISGSFRIEENPDWTVSLQPQF